MEPISFIAFCLFAGGLGSTGVKMVARKDLRESNARYSRVWNEAKQTYNRTVTTMNAIAHQRRATLMWLPGRADRAAKTLGISQAMFGKETGAFGGKTLAEMEALIRRARDVVTSPSNPFDATVTLTSGAALLIEGVEHLNKVGAIHLDVLHHTVTDALSGMTGMSYDAIGGVLGSLGDTGVLDALGDSLVVLSALKLGYNIWKINDLIERKDQLEKSADALEASQVEALRLNKFVADIEAAVKATGYELYKAAYFTDVASIGDAQLPAALRKRLTDKLLSAARAWWVAMNTDLLAKNPAIAA